MTREEQMAMQFQMLRNQLQSTILQKENHKVQKNEIEESLKELKEGDEVYKAVGMLIIRKNYSDLSKDLKEQIESLDSKIKSLEMREKQIRNKLEEMSEKLNFGANVGG